MCLTVSTDTKVRIAEENIICYKIVKKLEEKYPSLKDLI